MNQVKNAFNNTQNNSNFWLVVYSMNSGDFKNATMSGDLSDNIEGISAKFESNYPEYKVIHIGEGEQPPKTYRSLEYVN